MNDILEKDNYLTVLLSALYALAFQGRHAELLEREFKRFDVENAK